MKQFSCFSTWAWARLFARGQSVFVLFVLFFLGWHLLLQKKKRYFSSNRYNRDCPSISSKKAISKSENALGWK